MTTPLIEAIYQAKTTPLHYKSDSSVDLKQLQKDVQPHFEAIAKVLNTKTDPESFKQSVELILQELAKPGTPFVIRSGLEGSFDLAEQFKIQLAKALTEGKPTGEKTTEFVVDILSRTTEFNTTNASELRKITGRVNDERKPTNKLEEKVMMSKLNIIFDALAEKIAVKNDEDFKEAILWVNNQYSKPGSPIGRQTPSGKFEMQLDAARDFANKFADQPNYTEERRKVLIDTLSNMAHYDLISQVENQRRSSLKA